MKGEPETAPRRFYSTAEGRAEDGAFAVLLDGRGLRTPKRQKLAAPTLALAQAIAEEWNTQGEFIRAETMPLTRLSNVALDWIAGARGETVAAVAKYAETDLLCHRADAPAPLVARQNAAWDKLLDWADRALGARLVSGAGILALAQPPETQATLEAHAAALDDFALAGLAHGAALAGSAVIGFALAWRAIGAEEAFAAAALDDLYQLEVWGEDGEARARLDRLRDEFAALERFFAALN